MKSTNALETGVISYPMIRFSMRMRRSLVDLRRSETILYNQVVTATYLLKTDLQQIVGNGLEFSCVDGKKVFWVTVNHVRLVLRESADCIEVDDYVFKNHIL